MQNKEISYLPRLGGSKRRVTTEKADQAKKTNERLISTTIHSYIMLAGDQARKHILTEDQKKQIRTTWLEKKRVGKQGGGAQGDEGDQEDKHIKDIQKAAQEFKEMLIQVLECDVANMIHAAKAKVMLQRPKNFTGSSRPN